MNRIFERVFFGNEKSPVPPRASSVSSELTTRDIENYYLRVIVDSMRRMMVPDDHIEVGVRRVGHSRRGVTAFAGYVRLRKWDPLVTPVLLQNMPVIDGRIRQVVRASVILEHTHFAGLWFQASSATEGSPTSLLGMPAEIKYHSGAAAASR